MLTLNINSIFPTNGRRYQPPTSTKLDWKPCEPRPVELAAGTGVCRICHGQGCGADPIDVVVYQITAIYHRKTIGKWWFNGI